MEGVPVEEVDCEKDLGVTFSTDLKPTAHCKDIYSKANRMLGLLSRTIKYKNPAVLTALYKSIVRPHLEYCSTTWNPHYNKNKFLLEKIQHRFARMFPHLRSLSYENRLHQLGLWSLEEQRNRADVIELFKMVKGLSSTPLVTIFQEGWRYLNQRTYLKIGEEALSLWYTFVLLFPEGYQQVE